MKLSNYLLKSFRDLIKKIIPDCLVNFLRKMYNSTLKCLWSEKRYRFLCWKFSHKNSKNKYLHFSFLFEKLQVKKKPQYFLYFSRKIFIDLFNTFLETCGISFTFHSFFNIRVSFESRKNILTLFQPLPAKYQNNNRHSFLLITALTIIIKKHTLGILLIQILNKKFKTRFTINLQF